MPTTHPTTFDHGDTEYWQLRGFFDYQLERVAKSAPEYWLDAYDFSPEQAVAASRTCRNDAWNMLAHRWGDSFKYDIYRRYGSCPEAFDTETWGYVLSRAAEQFKEELPEEPDPKTKARRLLEDGAFLQIGPRLCEQSTLQGFFPDQGAQWGPFRFGNRPDAAAHHYCVVGMPRAGKTVLIRLLLRSVPEARMIVYDDKTNLISAIDFNEECLHILNPFDSRCSAWDIAADSLHRTPEIARLLIPKHDQQNPFFLNTSRALLAGVMDALNALSPANWSFLDLLLSAQQSNIRQILSQHGPGQTLLQTHLSSTDERTAQAVLSTLDSELIPYKPIAAAWSQADTKVSLIDWADGSDCDLVLGNHDAHRTAMGPINRVFFQLIAEALLDVTTRYRGPRPTYFVLDELEQLGTLESLVPLMNKGTSLGITLVLGFHDIQALRHYYGQATDGIVTMCGHYAFLRVNNPVTARWASDLIGHQEVLVPQRTKATSKQHETETLSHRHEQRPLVPPTALTQLPLTDRRVGLTGYFKSISHPSYRGHISGNYLFGPKGVISHYDNKDFDPRPRDHLLFPEDTAAPLKRFFFSPQDEPDQELQPEIELLPASTTASQPFTPPVNEQIRTTPVRVLDETGEEIGILPTDEAIELAQERGLDLVLVDPPRNNQPAVCEVIRPDSGAPESTDVPDADTSKPPDDAARQDEDWDLNDIDRVL